MPTMSWPTYPYIWANLGLYRVIRRSRVKTMPREAFCMIASISRNVSRRAASLRALGASDREGNGMFARALLRRPTSHDE
jgi:hypothetical protein